MSRASKVFLASSVLVSGLTVYGVHFLQQRESDTMYQGVLRDEARLRDKAAALLTLGGPSSSSSLATSPAHATHSSHTPLNTPSSPVQQPLDPSPSSSSSPWSATTRPPAVMQPPPLLDDDCETCRISPPPQLVELQSAEARRAERTAREREYEAQKRLAGDLRKEQGVGGERLV